MTYQTKPSETDQRLDQIALLLGELLALAAAESDHPIGAGTKQLLRKLAVRVPANRAPAALGPADARLDLAAEVIGDDDTRAAATRVIDARLSKAHDRLIAASEVTLTDPTVDIDGARRSVRDVLRALALRFDAAQSDRAPLHERAAWHDIARALTGDTDR